MFLSVYELFTFPKWSKQMVPLKLAQLPIVTYLYLLKIRKILRFYVFCVFKENRNEKLLLQVSSNKHDFREMEIPDQRKSLQHK